MDRANQYNHQIHPLQAITYAGADIAWQTIRGEENNGGVVGTSHYIQNNDTCQHDRVVDHRPSTRTTRALCPHTTASSGRTRREQAEAQALRQSGRQAGKQHKHQAGTTIMRKRARRSSGDKRRTLV
ncbi:hypothetical protein PoB_006205900 [Plakobranchus ocellatus]|uniref:Uncharacterized protein n=1 Tax=Plakobranchus ocellatus TaxID=259542 RepID=A0AAV4CUH2_9GAST|nr:hypothetical protein PoB_006205900 [Plakobranchus ocellatus]